MCPVNFTGRKERAVLVVSEKRAVLRGRSVYFAQSVDPRESNGGGNGLPSAAGRAANFPTLVKHRRSNNPKNRGPQTAADFVNKERLFRFGRIRGSKTKRSANRTACSRSRGASRRRARGFCGRLVKRNTENLLRNDEERMQSV